MSEYNRDGNYQYEEKARRNEEFGNGQRAATNCGVMAQVQIEESLVSFCTFVSLIEISICGILANSW